MKPSPLPIVLLGLSLLALGASPGFALEGERTRTSSFRGYPSQRPHPCEQSSCYPATGNLLIGRETRLQASSTCGLEKAERYCIVSHLEDRKKCFWCDSRDQFSHDPQRHHRIEHIVYNYFPGTRKRSWWQSQNGIENVTIQLDLEAEFHFTHLIIYFKTFRPAGMLIERSYDFGKTWQVYRYFAADCRKTFPEIPQDTPRQLTDIVCEQRYSNVQPSSGGEIIFRVLPPNLSIDNPYSQEVQNLLKMTNLRINFTKLHTLGDDLLDNRQEIQEKYYYAINDMIVRGSCSCYGHASRCLPLPNVPELPDMVHGRCECTHNTKGLNCELCEDFYNDLPWKPAVGKQTNHCKRCNCNNHATSCHFDEAVYAMTGQVSGGFCDDCQHSTMGRSCEQCKPFYYQEDGRDLGDPEICQACDCDPKGSLDDGICDSKTDLANGLESGRCHCKANVDGRRCDKCKNGFWNFDEVNPEGCQPCTCNILGTIHNQGCNEYSGECICKRFVTGRDCNQCLVEYWGLSDDPDGCRPCDCDRGGSYDNNCDVISGQCRCRRHVTGRRCDHTEQSYFTGSLDFLVYEGELAKGSEKCQVVIREPHRDNRENTWTGTGFMRTFEKSQLEFDVDNIQTSMDYVIVIRYEPQLPVTWDKVKVVIERPGPVDQSGPCANTNPEDDVKYVDLIPGARSAEAYPPVCLEANTPYKIRLEFESYNPHIESPTASVLIDSIALMPHIDSIPFLDPSPENIQRRTEYNNLRCQDAYYEPNHRSPNEEACKKYHYSIGFYTFGGAFSCKCDPTGSYSSICDSLGGACQCKPNVVGRRCDRCAAGTYGFGPEGCIACDCNSIGALDNMCEVTSGQCRCRANTYGRVCDQCQTGFWNFPDCQRCECNGHAVSCDSHTGICLECTHYTEGPHCNRCNEGYYGDPRTDGDIPCRPCSCPDTIESGHSYATRCSLDAHHGYAICDCAPGYGGARCDVCADNYYGNPEVKGGSCQTCNCSNNIDVTRPGNCDPHSGQCVQCLFNTEGDHCERCKPDFYGDAVNQLCRSCICNLLGTDQKAGFCDRISGQCPCLPNVEGISCDQCKKNHWKIASGQGCEPCNCDSIGSTDEQCNIYDGQCNCKPGFGGRQCNQCQANHWGNPNIQCHPCECNPEGSATLQCHRNNGSCVCTEGIGGEKCDRCARGYLGHDLYCTSCGECFDNWDRILNSLKEETLKAISEASKIKQTGVTGAYTNEFVYMEKKINEVEQILNSTTISNQDLENLTTLIDKLRNNLNESEKSYNDAEKAHQNINQQISFANLSLSDLRRKAELLKTNAHNLKDNGTKLQEANVEGALRLTHEAQKRSREAQQLAEGTRDVITEAEKMSRRTEARVNRTADTQQEQEELHQENMNDLSQRLDDLESNIPDLNNLICDKRGDPCDPLCGGAGCGSCGGISCENGTVSKADSALHYAQNADKKIKEHETKTSEVLRGIKLAKSETDRALELAKEGYKNAVNARSQSEHLLSERNDMISQLEEFLNTSGAQPSEIKLLAKQTLEKQIKLQPGQITDLANEINQTIVSLTDIDTILSETSEDLALANSLKEQADKARKEAEGTFQSAQGVISSLEEAKVAQDKAEDAIMQVNKNIESANKDLTQIRSEYADAQNKANETEIDLSGLNTRLETLQAKVLKNKIDIEKVKEESMRVVDEASKAQRDSEKLAKIYQDTTDSLSDATRKTDVTLTKAMILRDKANQLSLNSSNKLKSLQDLHNNFNGHEDDLKRYSKLIDELTERMNLTLQGIAKKSEWYRICET